MNPAALIAIMGGLSAVEGAIGRRGARRSQDILNESNRRVGQFQGQNLDDLLGYVDAFSPEREDERAGMHAIRLNNLRQVRMKRAIANRYSQPHHQGGGAEYQQLLGKTYQAEDARADSIGRDATSLQARQFVRSDQQNAGAQLGARLNTRNSFAGGLAQALGAKAQAAQEPKGLEQLLLTAAGIGKAATTASLLKGGGGASRTQKLLDSTTL